MRQTLYADEHPDVAASFNNVGVAYTKLGVHERAEESHRRALKVRQALF